MSTKIRICIRTAIWIILQCISFMAYAQNIGGACITSRTYTTSDASSYIVQKVYDNGLGDVVEEVSVGITPSGKDLVTLHEYDAFRRSIRKWLPVASSGSTGDFVASASLKSSSASQYGDSYAYGKTIYDALHFNKPGETYRTGNAYKYNGKELDRMHGLDWYDHGARHNDAAIGRWHVMDPLCEKYYDVSPYAYCAGDPVNAIDPDGKSIWTKMLKTTMKIGSRVASNGLRELGKAATYAESVSDIKELVKYEKTKFKLM